MSFTITSTDGTTLAIVQDGTANTKALDITLIGSNYAGYGLVQNENFVSLLENFSNITPPPNAIKGQLWFDSLNQRIKVYTGLTQNGAKIWDLVGAVTTSTTAPTTPILGDLWFDTVNLQLNLYNNNTWVSIGPSNYGSSAQFSTVSVTDTASVAHTLFVAALNGKAPFVISSDSPYTLSAASQAYFASSMVYTGTYTVINPGVTLTGCSSGITSDFYFNGTSTSADKLSTARTINGVNFDGTSNIIISSTTTNSLNPGSYITGPSFNGSANQTWDVYADTAATGGTVVARDITGSFSANQINASLIGNATSATTTNNITGGSLNQIPVQSSVGATSFISAPTIANPILAYNGSSIGWQSLVSLLPAFFGDVTSSPGSASLTIPNSGISAGSYTNVTVNAKGLVTGGDNQLSISGVQSNAYNFATATYNSSTYTYSVSLTPSISALTDGLIVNFKTGLLSNNSQASNLSVNTLSAPLLGKSKQPLTANSIISYSYCSAVYDATLSSFILLQSEGGNGTEYTLASYGYDSTTLNNHYSISITPSPNALYDGMKIGLQVAHTNNLLTAPTLTVGSLPQTTITNPGGAALSLNQLVTGDFIDLVYINGNFEIQNSYFMNAFIGIQNQLLAVTGFQVLPGGLILNWGNETVTPAGTHTSGSAVATFSKSYSTMVFAGFATKNISSITDSNYGAAHISLTSLTTATISAGLIVGISTNVFWFTIGY